MMTTGIDIGSSTIKLVQLNGGQICHAAVQLASNAPLDVARRMLSSVPSCPAVATGYGRDLLGIPSITEIKAHALGARWSYPHASAVIDIGGQDLKVITLDKKGSVLRFEMNDRCAAGTGRFLEIMAQKLDYSLAEFGDAALKGDCSVTITALCTVFAESEVVGLLNKNKQRESIARGLHMSVVKKIAGMFKRLDPGPRVVIASGGGAKNAALLSFLGAYLQIDISIPENPQIAGALGCALAANSL